MFYNNENWMRHREKNFKRHDTLANIEIAVKSEIEGMHFDKKAVMESILAVAKPHIPEDAKPPFPKVMNNNQKATERNRYSLSVA